LNFDVFSASRTKKGFSTTLLGIFIGIPVAFFVYLFGLLTNA